MKFKTDPYRTNFFIPESQNKLSLKSNILTIGSCFSDNIGNKLKLYKFNSIVNPLGTLFNPFSIFKGLLFLFEKESLDPKYLIQNQDIWNHFHVHSSFSNANKNQLLNDFQNQVKRNNHIIKKTDFIFITLGTAIVYQLKSNDEIVANCHKIPSSNFSKRLLSSNEIINQFKSIYKHLSENTQIIFTVSPIRHIKETVQLNSVSKSILRVACEELQMKYDNVSYFPAYEIMMDDLRDYRFYSEDLIHPSNAAVEYIWDRFKETYFNESEISFVSKWEKIIKDLNHRAFNPNSVAHKKFIQKLEKKVFDLGKEYNIDVSEELNSIM